MQGIHITVLAACIGGLLGGPVGIAQAGGQQLFLQQKCNQCHTVSSRGIRQLPKTAAGEADAEAAAGKIKPPDLGGHGGKLAAAYGSKAQAAEFLKKFLRKQVANKKGRRHKKSFRGGDADLQAVVDWVLGL